MERNILFLGLCGGICILQVFILNRIKLSQQIYPLSPGAHQAKSGTPSLGGVAIAASIGLGMFIFKLTSPESIWCFSLLIAFATLGLADDILSLFKKENKGLRVSQKLLLQVGLGLIATVTFHFYIRPVNPWEFALFWFVLVATPNATNLTDGLDGLLAGLGIISVAGFYVLFLGASNTVMQTLCLTVGLSLAGFLLVNFHPAKIFMGDTGSLGLGALIAGLSMVLGNPWVLLPLGAVYIIETVSVISQVFYFKKTGKRIFLMAPLHHHFELLGLSEIKTVLMFWAMGLGFLGLFIWRGNFF